ncbi:hypothetical protein [Methanobacterium sp.]|uniref:hypothetical protein n=1 Tax=Methanobacterium sp. TaxID=2164 RepID=UPI003C7841DF
MKILTYIMTVFLIIGLLGVPNSVFAQESSTGSNSVLKDSNSVVFDNTVPLLKGSSGGSRGGSSSSSKSSSKKIHDGDDDDDDDTTSGSSGGFWIIAIIFLVVFLGLIGFLVWFFFLRK